MLTVLAVVAVAVAALAYVRSAIFRTAQYWWPMVIIFAFQIPVDGWLTKLSAPIVIYNPGAILGLWAPWDIPIEDFGLGFAMVTLAIPLWRRWLDAGRYPGTPKMRPEPIEGCIPAALRQAQRASRQS